MPASGRVLCSMTHFSAVFGRLKSWVGASVMFHHWEFYPWRDYSGRIGSYFWATGLHPGRSRSFHFWYVRALRAILRVSVAGSSVFYSLSARPRVSMGKTAIGGAFLLVCFIRFFFAFFSIFRWVDSVGLWFDVTRWFSGHSLFGLFFSLSLLCMLVSPCRLLVPRATERPAQGTYFRSALPREVLEA